MRVTIESVNPTEFEKIIQFLKSIRLDYVTITKDEEQIEHPPSSDSFEDIFGVWKNEPRDLNTIRKESW